ncbi:ABC transporter ATP-binding protein [methanotrophic endosymbiont of Bathymodiolus puteoserpentis (Logatchev)]|jgi:putative ABC transport system ATP-binding protein|uniref:ABC transporter ATP-binding protein n=1 Tax=methanotrophic endosymbiont of Bathymodiolus puteoserpentis (Logatchev) TaxID=343235 RepID=UPI0013C742F1|nr:ABC transporter ATP-binding protein [methanotrophic endosymbiont of Bathymodiolus puteoserpentis (Logatchev)]SHE20828.1 ABC transporter, ATP-binding protein [methanotrophic endosymbiont of Bathymodiolus puteoserpentis (Logatchev)]
MNSLLDENKSYIITVKNLYKTVNSIEGSLTILSDVGFKVKPAESIAIIGASGSGKSTLLSLLAGLDRSTSGTIEIFGQSLNKLNEDQRASLRNKMIGFVFQSFQLLPNLNALENVMLPLELVGDKQAKSLATQLLDRVGLSHRLKHIPNQLSGGEQQRVALARAFVTHPKILFADEPTGNLDSNTGEHIIDLLFELNKENRTTLVLVTHDQRLANRCVRTIKLSGGRIV